jgi:hypothetical protein
VTATIASPVTVTGVSYTCTGWTGTGSVPATGTGTSVIFVITATSTLTWNWQTTSSIPVPLTVYSDYGSPSPSNQTYTSGTSVTCKVPTTVDNVNGVNYNVVTANGVTYACTGWTGTGSVSASGTSTSTTFTITVASTINWNWIPIPASLDVWTNNGGQGWNVTSSPFGPQQLVTLYASVTSAGGVPQAAATVTFNIYDNGAQIDSRTATTDSTGTATVTYRLPWPATNPTSTFGIINITSTVNVAGKILTDSCPFTYNYLVQTTGVTITNNDGTTTSNGPSFSRYTGPTVNAKITVETINWNTPTSFYITATICDSNGVPVAYVSLPTTINPATSHNLNAENSQSYTINLSIPSYAYVGTATLYVNLYTADPTKQGVPLCPEASTTIVIDASKA